MENDKYAENVPMKESILRGDYDSRTAAGSQAQPMADNSSANEYNPVQTVEQERTSYTRRLYATIADNEASIRALKVVLNMLERKQKNAYILAENLQRNDANQAQLVRELRKHVDG